MGGTLTQIDIDLLQQQRAAYQQHLRAPRFPPQHPPCPACGYCPHCGRGGQRLTPMYPPQTTGYVGPMTDIRVEV
jgi:hypothetical protein